MEITNKHSRYITHIHYFLGFWCAFFKACFELKRTYIYILNFNYYKLYEENVKYIYSILFLIIVLNWFAFWIKHKNDDKKDKNISNDLIKLIKENLKQANEIIHVIIKTLDISIKQENYYIIKVITQTLKSLSRQNLYASRNLTFNFKSSKLINENMYPVYIDKILFLFSKNNFKLKVQEQDYLYSIIDIINILISDDCNIEDLDDAIKIAESSLK